MTDDDSRVWGTVGASLKKSAHSMQMIGIGCLMIGGMKTLSLIGLVLFSLHSMSSPVSAETEGLTLEPIRVGNPEFDSSGHGCQLTGTGSADAQYWSPKEHDVADSEWFDGEVAALGSRGDCAVSLNLSGEAIASGATYRVGFGIARWGPDTSKILVSIADEDERLLATSAAIEAGLWTRQFVDLEIPSNIKVSGPCTLVFRTIENKNAARESATLIDKVSLARISADEPGFQSIFNGKNLDGWIGNTEGYGVEGGAIRTFPKRSGGNLYTSGTYDDFVFRFAFKVPPGANNGIAVRSPATGDAAYQGMELQVLDNSHPNYAGLKPWQFHGSIYGIAPALRGYQSPPGSWNLQEIRAEGRRIRIILNGAVISDVDLDEATREGTLSGREHPGLARDSGHLGFCGHGDLVYFKDLRVRPIFRPESKP